MAKLRECLSCESARHRGMVPCVARSGNLAKSLSCESGRHFGMRAGRVHAVHHGAGRVPCTIRVHGANNHAVMATLAGARGAFGVNFFQVHCTWPCVALPPSHHLRGAVESDALAHMCTLLPSNSIAHKVPHAFVGRSAPDGSSGQNA